MKILHPRCLHRHIFHLLFAAIVFVLLLANRAQAQHTAFAYYTFDDSGFLGQDSTGNYNSLYGESWWGPVHVFSANAVAGGGAVQFFGTSCITTTDYITTNYDNLLSGSFTFSAWVNTTNSVGNDDDDAVNGQAIFWAYDDHNNAINGTIPLGITGCKAAFSVWDENGNATTIHSQTSVNDGNYHLITVTRNAASGEMKLYVDGNLEDYDIGPTVPLDGNNYFLSIGGTTIASYAGLLDDFQVYSGVLSDAEVAEVYDNPGTMVPDVTGPDFNDTLGTSGWNWFTGGDSCWSVETANTYNGAYAAAESGPVTGSQSSILTTTVTGPGTLTFDWASQDDCNNFYYEFTIDGQNPVDTSCGDGSWSQQGPFTIPAGQHTLTWTTYANGDNDPTEVGFLDNVSFIQESAPVITLNPFNQTNYPGYSVWLNAAVTDTNADISWQWYNVSSGAIPGATSSYYIPTNSGTPGVAGQYYAIVSNDAGSAITTTAAVSFVSAVLPPGWASASKSPFSSDGDFDVIQDYAWGCTTDTNGNIYTAGEFGGDVEFGSGSVYLDSGSGGDAAVLVKQSPDYTPIWAAAITNAGAGSAYGYCVAPGPAGGAYLAGDYSGTNWLGTNELIDNGNGNMFLASFNANGSNLWVQTFGGTNSDFITINALAADPAGNVTLAGLLGTGPVTIGSSNYVVIGQQGLIVQLDPTGAVRWSQLIPTSPEYVVYSGGRLYMSLPTTASSAVTNVVIGGISNVTDRAWAIACLDDTNGQGIWVCGVGAQSGSGNGNSYYTGLVDDVPRLAVSGTNLFMTGVAYACTASFGNLTVNFGDMRGQYLARYDTNGNVFVATAYGSVSTTPEVAVANASGVYVAGDFDQDSTFGNDLIAAPIGARPYTGEFSQAFVAKFDNSGNPLWADDAVSTATANLTGITLATNGVWTCGWTLSGYYPQPEYTLFAPYEIYSDAEFVSGGAGGSTSVIWYPGGVLANIADTASQVSLIDPARNGANFQFQFYSQAEINYNVLYRTNLVTGSWKTNSTVSGDGTLKTVDVPMSVFAPSQQGYVRVSGQ